MGGARRKRRPLSRIRSSHVFGVLVFTMLFAPFAFGSVEPWSLAVMQCSVFLAASMLLYKKRATHGRLYRVPGALPLLGLLGLMAVQTLPLPQWFVGLLSPNTLKIYKETALVLTPGAWVTLSLDPRATLMDLLRYGSCAAYYALAIQLMAKSRRYGNLTRVLAWTASALAVAGIMSVIAPNGRVLWIRENPWQYASVGPYLNRNHYANLMAMLLPMVFGLFIALRPMVSFHENYSLWQRVSEIINSGKVSRHMLGGLVAVLVAVSILLSLSRGGIISAALALALFGILYFRHDRRVALALGALTIACLVMIGTVGSEHLLERTVDITRTDSLSVAGRLNIWSDMADMLRDFPVFGVGFGAMHAVYPAYRTLEGRVSVDHAHNDYLELLGEGGVVAFVLAAVFIGRVMYVAYMGIRQRRDGRATVLGISALCAVAAMLFHAGVDFSMHLGANGLYFFLMLAVLVSASHSGLGVEDNDAPLSYPGQYTAPRYGMAYGLSLAILFAAASLGSMNVMGTARLEEVWTIPPGQTESRMAMAQSARILNPLDPRAAYQLAFERMNELDFEGALKEAEASLLRYPLSGETLDLGARLMLGQDEPERAEALMKAAVRYAPRWSESPASYAGWLISVGRTSDALDALAVSIGREHYRAGKYVDFALGRGVGIMDLFERFKGETAPEVRLALAIRLQEAGMEVEAGGLLDKMLPSLASDPERRPTDYMRANMLYRRLGRTGEAFEALRMGMDVFPENVELVVTLAASYELDGRTEHAIAEYRRALEMDPASQRAYNSLKRLGQKP